MAESPPPQIHRARRTSDDSMAIAQNLPPNFLDDPDYTSWDIVLKNTPQLPLLESMINKYGLVNKGFMAKHSYSYSPPFMIFYDKEVEVDLEVTTIGNFTEIIDVPHQHELVRFFENFNLFRYPKDPLLLYNSKFFFVHYEQDYLHAINASGLGIIII